jgi:cytochrome c-type biogenesis protein CcmH/NrfF
MSASKNIAILSEASFSGAKDLLFAMLQSARKWVPQVSRLRPGKATSLPLTFFIKSAPPRGPRGQVFVRGVEALLLAIAVCFSLGASDAGSRFNDLGHRLMCTCSCAQLLGECNHVGCPASGHMREELSAAIASGATDDQILSSFAAKYGATVLAAPTTHGFDLVAWIAPIAVFAAALLGTILLVRQWSIGKTQTTPAPVDAEMDAMRAKVRRETGAENDGGF